MKKIIFALFYIFSIFNLFADHNLNYEKSCISCKNLEKHMKNYYFSLDQLIIEKDQIYVDFDGKITPVYTIQKDIKGYFVQLWEDNSWCPYCEDWVYSDSLKCCLSTPSKCPLSCQIKLVKKINF